MEVLKKNILIELLSISILFFIFIIFLSGAQKPQTVYPAQGFIPAPSPTPTPFNPFPYNPPKIPYSRAYRIMLVGDSIIASLGPNAQLLRQHLIELYPEHEFVNYNYGFGATSIETLPERLSQETTYKEQKFQSILSQGFDLIIIETFAYNPLPQYSDGEGLAKHISTLDESIKQIILKKPEAVVTIMTPIAPSKTLFAKGVYDLTPIERAEWAEERIVYINKVIEYAREKQIPLINVYEKSLTPQGEADLKYINPDDYIHPSAAGVDLISRTIADFIFSKKIFPE
ncbi:hypothetical protein A2962_00470 [Candidatus Woesebacteria bacterium RIFCSPLOWO2_01_FULL_39_61]|uniref:Uncharacterized protein n=1 Tax=Candidatus Woesebacteria bacterium RIFCSPHIGHO2_02_FULL_39_13 TaxID=1802505 RepID=A0A1F7Z1W2_9BACT|nr:MAG: hypothetical protein A2692_03760 [Candidatus Woesebacteria bacterium RIFCSPHIGHO2_01_FULL_39_95]OGM33613.1 MAG: hypothetical protein A3D01_01525 [Candidatus Woesebacteria bacterium RIFCSPHIGHO2_02_FULL_39_13]OGM37306.1 MAG: hypothetical protein A3E13_05230 [Candidatus Woesebacteria bacterium RIFCSPHIGHO2_12_FULL_40_20]OGM68528.1 MAG: hypothetical protein A2962_00470 [Candidatus Woesebacteria bacterium RIFCSPLOWO2_01_FULL_39_61]OGM73453.1 MAG: hypothetical protein A3H19_00870 [Candidatus